MTKNIASYNNLALIVPKFAQEMQWIKMNNLLTKLSDLSHTDAHCKDQAVAKRCFIFSWMLHTLESTAS